MTDENKKKRKAKLTKIIWIVIIGFFVLTIFGSFILPLVWGPIGVHIDYSQGERTVKVIKISEKGLIWKSWEIESVLAQEGFAVTYIWSASIDNKDPNKNVLLQKLNNAFETGQTVKIRYEEKAGYVPWRSKTRYFIKEIR